MNILVIAGLQESQIKYKIIPLSKSEAVDKIFLLRKKAGPVIQKVQYIVLPTICKYALFYLLLTPIMAIKITFSEKINLIISYHYVPHGFFAYLVHTITRVPFVYSQIDMDIQHYMQNPIFDRLIRFSLRNAHKINVPGSNSRRFWNQKGFPDSRLISIHSTIDTENDFFPLVYPQDKVYDFIYIGTFEKRKRLHQLLEAFYEVKKKGFDFRFALVGKGTKEETHEIHLLIDRLNLGDSVKLLGHRKDIRELLNQSRAFILLSKNEGIPCAMMEAMACGIVPVVTDVADIADVVENDVNGFLLSPDPSIPEIADVIIRVMNRGLKPEFSQNARQKIIDNHSYTSAIRKWNSFLNDFKF